MWRGGRLPRPDYDGRAGTIPPISVDQLTAQTTPLSSLVDELRRQDRFQAFVGALPTRARVSEPVLPLLLASLHAELGRPLLVLLPEDADARDAAEGASWFVGDGLVALLPSRGVGWDSGLTPPPHLVGERYRALDVLGAGGLVCASVRALGEWLPPVDARPTPLRLRVGEEPGIDGLSEHLALAGYERVDRVEERGQYAVRGGLVDVFPSTGREPLRVELFGDEIEQIRAFSPFTQRALHAEDAAVVYPAGERRRDLDEPSLRDDEGDDVVPGPNDLVPSVDQAPDLVWSPDDVRRAREEDGLQALELEAATQLDPFPRSPRAG
jgi:transcription-repair coupling factor (superfamily II helicase)